MWEQDFSTAASDVLWCHIWVYFSVVALLANDAYWFLSRHFIRQHLHNIAHWNRCRLCEFLQLQKSSASKCTWKPTHTASPTERKPNSLKKEILKFISTPMALKLNSTQCFDKSGLENQRNVQIERHHIISIRYWFGGKFLSWIAI